MRLSKLEWEEYCRESDAMRERGVQVGDILVCDEGATPQCHEYTKKPCVRITEHAIIDGTGPRFFIHGYRMGLVAYVPDEEIQPGAEFRVVEKFKSSVVLEQV